MDYKCPKCGHLFKNVDYQPGLRCWFCGHREDVIEATKFEVSISVSDVQQVNGYTPEDQQELIDIVEAFEQIFQEDYFFTIMKKAVHEHMYREGRGIFEGGLEG